MKVNVETEGLVETLAALKGVDKDLRKEANAEIRTAARTAAGGLALALKASASSSGVPVAPRVAASVRVVSDRIPTVSVGGSKRVGRRGAPAAALVWGSEQGGTNFAAAPGGSYWIAPAVERFRTSGAIPVFRRAVYETFRRYGLT